MPISRTDYASIANKQQTGFPTSYWFDRLINPNLYIWPLSPQSGIYTLTYYRMRQAQDSDLALFHHVLIWVVWLSVNEKQLD
jgi:hypothetical protein